MKSSAPKFDSPMEARNIIMTFEKRLELLEEFVHDHLMPTVFDCKVDEDRPISIMERLGILESVLTDCGKRLILLEEKLKRLMN